MSTLIDLVSQYISNTGSTLITAVILTGVAGLLILTGAAARIVTYIQQVIE